MGKAIAVGVIVVVIVALVLWFTGWYQKFQARQEDKRTGRAIHGDLNARQEKEILALLDNAHQIMNQLGTNTNVEHLGDPEIIRDTTRVRIRAWTDTYNKNRKVN